MVLQLSFIFLIIIFIFLDKSSLYSSRRSYTLLSTLYRKTFLINLANDFQSAKKHKSEWRIITKRIIMRCSYIHESIWQWINKVFQGTDFFVLFFFFWSGLIPIHFHILIRKTRGDVYSNNVVALLFVLLCIWHTTRVVVILRFNRS